MAETLTQKQVRFVEHYLGSGNATASARAAGYKGNQATLGSVAGENLKKPLIRAEIERRRAELRCRTTIAVEAKRMALWEIAQTHKRDDPDAAIKAIHELNVMDGDYKDPRQARRVSFEDILRMVVPD